jgi:hypothetical protein
MEAVRAIVKLSAQLPLGLSLAPCADTWQFEEFAVQRADYAPYPQKGNGNQEHDPHPLQNQEDRKSMEGSKHCEASQNPPDEERKDVENQGLPRVEAHIGLPVVRRDSKEEQRRDDGEVSDCAKRIV